MRSTEPKELKILKLAEDACAACLEVASQTKLKTLKDQLERSSTSFALNMAEAMGRRGKDRRRILHIAYGSALETKMALRILARQAQVPSEVLQHALELTDQVAAVCYRMIR